MSENMMMNDPDHSAWNLNTVSAKARAPRKGGGITPYNGLYGEAPPERGVFSDFKYVTKKRFEKMHSPISLFFFEKYHNTFCCSSKILHKHCFQFLLGRFLPREIENKAYSKFLKDDKEYYGIFFKRRISHLHISQNAPCLTPKILLKYCF